MNLRPYAKPFLWAFAACIAVGSLVEITLSVFVKEAVVASSRIQVSQGDLGFMPDHGPDRALDGNRDTFFHSTPGVPPGSITFRFREPVAISSIAMAPQGDLIERLPGGVHVHARSEVGDFQDGGTFLGPAMDGPWASFGPMPSAGAVREWKVVFERKPGADYLCFSEVRFMMKRPWFSLDSILWILLASLGASLFYGLIMGHDGLRGHFRKVLGIGSPEPRKELFEDLFTLLVSASVAFAAYLGLVVIAQFIPWLRSPDVSRTVAKGIELTIFGADLFSPKPTERLLIISAFLVIPLGTAGLMFLLRKVQHKAGPGVKVSVFAVAVLAFTALVVHAFLALDHYPMHGAVSYLSFYLQKMGSTSMAAGLVLSVAAFFMMERLSTGFHRVAVAGGVLLSICAGAAVLFFAQFHFPKLGNEHLDALYYSMVQTMGGVPLLRDGFSNTYGLYPEFLKYLFTFIPLDVNHFSMVMGALTLLSLVCPGIFLYLVCRNKVVAFAGIFAFAFFSYLNPLWMTFDPYFQYMPIRTLFPGVFLLLSYAWLKNPRAVWTWLLAFISGAAVLWSPDSGSILAVLCCLLPGLTWLFGIPSSTKDLKKVLVQYGLLAAGFASFLLLFVGQYLLWYRSMPDFMVFWNTIKVFSTLGFMLIPMPWPHPWILYLATCFFAIAIGILHFIRGEMDLRSRMTVVLAVFCCGMFMYYEGRSHTWTYLHVIGWWALLFAVLVDRLWALIVDGAHWKARIPLGILFAVCFSILVSSSLTLFGGIQRLYPLYKNKYVTDLESAYYFDSADFMSRELGGDTRCFIYSRNQGIFHGLTQTTSIFNPGVIDLFLKKDLARLGKTLETNRHAVFVEKGYAPVSQVLVMIQKGYRKKAESPYFDAYILR